MFSGLSSQCFSFFSKAITFSPCLPFTKFQVKSCTFSFHIFSFLARCVGSFVMLAEKWMSENGRGVVRDVKSGKGVALAQQLHYETIEQKSQIFCFWGLVGFGLNQYNTTGARLTNHLLPWLLLYWLLCAQPKGSHKSQWGKQSEGEREKAMRDLILFLFHNQSLLSIYTIDYSWVDDKKKDVWKHGYAPTSCVSNPERLLWHCGIENCTWSGSF